MYKAIIILTILMVIFPIATSAQEKEYYEKLRSIKTYNPRQNLSNMML